MTRLQAWKWGIVWCALPLSACVPMAMVQAPEPQSCVACHPIEPNSFAVSKPMSGNDYPVSYRVQGPESAGYAKPVDYQTLVNQAPKPPRSWWPFGAAPEGGK